MTGEQLRVSEGNERGKRIAIEGALPIGRASTAEEGRLGGDPELSRRHARISRNQGGQLTIEDLGSANGTFVNGERIDAPRTLDLGDVIRLGLTVLEVADASGQVPEPTRLGAAAPGTVVTRPEPELVITEGEGKGRRLSLGEEFLMGRAVSGEGRLDEDPELSRRHARITRDASGELTIEDLGSANGTFVNGEPVREPRALKVGDSVRVGRTTLQLTDSGAAPSAPAPAAPAPSAPAPSAPAPSAPAPSAPAPVKPPVEPPPARPAPPRPAPPESVPAALPAGTLVAGCRIEEAIGHGDMGIVYRAEELALQRPVALKLIRPEHSQEERFRERFRRESKVAASIDHPNVIPILEADEENGVLFITMRLVEGTDLRALIASEGRVDPLRAARIVRQVGAGLDAAHARGLVHRDVKPANVLLARGDHVYLSDFGLAKHETSVAGLTRKGSIVARAEYVAPEQIVEDRADALTDVYALGCLLFEALTGQAPFADRGGGAAMMAHVDEPPPSAAGLVPGLPPQFDEVVQRAMAKQPGERYPSAGDLGEAALVAAGGLPRARQESVVATGEASPSAVGAVPAGLPADDKPAESGAASAAPGPAPGGTLRWAVALGFLAVLAIAMVVALGAIAKL